MAPASVPTAYLYSGAAGELIEILDGPGSSTAYPPPRPDFHAPTPGPGDDNQEVDNMAGAHEWTSRRRPAPVSYAFDVEQLRGFFSFGVTWRRSRSRCQRGCVRILGDRDPFLL